MEKLTAEVYQKRAAEAYASKEESFNRCDTDGYLSQWASGVTGDLNRILASLAEVGWVSEFPGLFSIQTGERVPAKIIYVKDRYNWNRPKAVWALIDPQTDKFTGTFLPVGENSRKQKKAGYIQKMELAPAHAKLEGSDVCNVRPVVYRTDGGYPKNG